jgi:hypothetical protein
MKEGKYFRIPEGPADVEALWNEAEPLSPGHVPSGIPPEEADAYRSAGTAIWPDSRKAMPDDYFEEIEQLKATGLIVHKDPNGRRGHQFYLQTPRRAWFNEAIWSIGVLVGQTPWSLASPSQRSNPVLTRADVSDVPAAFVADPFMIAVDSTWYMFFEVMNWRTRKGDIGLAISRDGLSWEYQRIVLSERFHLSYPYVFQWDGDFYMIPESYQAGAIRLYRATHFPTSWALAKTLLKGPYLVDASVFRYDGRWWLFTDASQGMHHDTLRLFFSNCLTGPWEEHPRSPLIEGDPHVARPAGRPISWEKNVIRFAQTCLPYYGTAVRAFEVTRLTHSDYQERDVTPERFLGPAGTGWNACGMHHIDAHLLGDTRWIAAVDGWVSEEVLRNQELDQSAKAGLASPKPGLASQLQHSQRVDPRNPSNESASPIPPFELRM